mmetsp:Transcript_18463/g.33449  ORF Transcript_18463/g.33449 Transcript_18463/m.33449 type:complete len:109 (+) Transcript_18463:1172-1498(+)
MFFECRSGVQLEVGNESFTNYKSVKWDYKRHTVQGTSNFESETWKILFLRDPVEAFFSRFALRQYAGKCESGGMDTAEESMIALYKSVGLYTATGRGAQSFCSLIGYI